MLMTEKKTRYEKCFRTNFFKKKQSMSGHDIAYQIIQYMQCDIKYRIFKEA